MPQVTERAEQASRQARHLQELRRRTQELERMLEIGSYDVKIRQRQAEIQSLIQRRASIESELYHLRRALSQLEGSGN